MLGTRRMNPPIPPATTSIHASVFWKQRHRIIGLFAVSIPFYFSGSPFDSLDPLRHPQNIHMGGLEDNLRRRKGRPPRRKPPYIEKQGIT
jgi:hypothetical protein